MIHFNFFDTLKHFNFFFLRTKSPSLASRSKNLQSKRASTVNSGIVRSACVDSGLINRESKKKKKMDRRRSHTISTFSFFICLLLLVSICISQFDYCQLRFVHISISLLLQSGIVLVCEMCSPSILLFRIEELNVFKLVYWNQQTEMSLLIFFFFHFMG